MGALKITYGDIAVNADIGSTVTTVSMNSFSDPSRLPFKSNRSKLATLEPNNWVLDGDLSLRESEKVPFWSKLMSTTDHILSDTSIVIKLNDSYSSTGITLVFDEIYDEYPSSVTIMWLKGGLTLSTMTFYPDSTAYFCKNPQEGFDEIRLKFNRTSIPERYCKINQIIFGTERVFLRDELRKANYIVEGDPISNTLSTSTLNWELNNIEDINFIFQAKQPVTVYDGDTLLGVTYIDSSKRIADNLYSIHGQDVIGLLETGTFPGKIYNKVVAKDAIKEILGPFIKLYYDPKLEGEVIDGYIKPCSKREALRQICFALGACVSSFRTDGLRIFKASDKSTSVIDLSTMFEGQEVNIASKVTRVVVYSHALTEVDYGHIKIDGKQYNDVATPKFIDNPNVTNADKEYVIEVPEMTLVTLFNIDKILQRTYNYLVKRVEMKAKVILEGHDLGEMIVAPTDWSSSVEGNISHMEISLSNLTTADITIRGD